MKKSIIIVFVSLAIVAASVTCLIVFMPHLQRVVSMSGGVLELEFEDGSKQYLAGGGEVFVDLNTRCKIRVITPIEDDKHVLKVKDSKGNYIEYSDGIVFDERKFYIFDLYQENGNFATSFYVEVKE